jgi:hypothetical protein
MECWGNHDRWACEIPLQLGEGLVSFWSPLELPSALHELEERQGLLSTSHDEVPQGCHASREALHLLKVARRTHLFDGLDLVRVRLYPAMRHEEPQQLAQRYAEGALGGVELDVYLSKVGEGFLQIFNEGMTLASFDDDVLDVGFCIPSHLSPQGLAHEPLESFSYVL